jgi:DNA polymerase bacteriophage-type
MDSLFWIIDFETKSRCDLKTQGADKYASDPSTDILCLAATPSNPADDREWLWYPHDGPLPLDFQTGLVKHIRNGGLIAAFNARFDQQIWEYIGVNEYLFPELKLENWYCIAAQARVNGLPGNLDDATRALNPARRKNQDGTRLIRLLSVPQADGQFYENRAELEKMGGYCLDDVRETKAVVNSCRVLSPTEHRDWLVSERINDRGVLVDLELAEVAQQHAEVETQAIGAELAELTGGVVTKHTQNQRIKKWVLERTATEKDADYLHTLMTVYKNGERKTSLAKDIRQGILGRADAGQLELADDVYNVIAALDDGNKSSVSKFKRMVERADDDGRVCGAFLYAGAATLRYTSRGLQVHNLRRDCWSPEETEELRAMLLSGQRFSEGAVMDSLSKLLRPAIVPAPGKKLVVGDWSSIENRALPWLSGDPWAENKLQLFREGADLYVKAADDVGIDDRQVGKVIELSLGYGGANGAFSSMARNYNVFLPDHQVTRIVKSWRQKNGWAVGFWDDLERAAVKAVRNPLTEFKAGRVTYIFVPDLMDGSLLCIMPGGGCITYPKARVATVTTEYGTQWELTALKANWKPAADDKEWPRFRLWRGLLAENVTQAFCAWLLRELVADLEDYCDVYPVVLHCHDEVALEVDSHRAEDAAKFLQGKMEAPPEGITGLPLVAEPAVMDRYGKG